MIEELKPATATHEQLVFLPAGDETLFGVLTRPTAEANGTAVVICTGGGSPTSSNRNRLSVRLCRLLAAQGYHAMRFDYHGVGESTGEIDRFRLDQPFVEDLRAVLAWLRRQGVTRFLLLGSCFGARTVLATAAAGVEGIEAVGLITPPPRDFERGEGHVVRLAEQLTLWQFVRRGLRRQVLASLLDPARRKKYAWVARKGLTAAASRTQRRVRPQRSSELFWVSRPFLDGLDAVVSAGIPTFFLYGEDDELWGDFQEARAGRLGQIEARAGGLIRVQVIPGQVHGFTRLNVQDAVVDAVQQWLAERRAAVGSGQ